MMTEMCYKKSDLNNWEQEKPITGKVQQGNNKKIYVGIAHLSCNLAWFDSNKEVYGDVQWELFVNQPEFASPSRVQICKILPHLIWRQETK